MSIQIPPTRDHVVVPGAPAIPNPVQDVKKRAFPRKVTIGFVLLAAAICLWTVVSLRGNSARSQTGGVAEVTVAVAKTTREDLSQYTTFTAEFVPYQQVSVHAKVAGYVRSIDVDIGDHVKTGQVLAVLEIPELNDDLKKASAELMTSQEEVRQAQANYDEVHLIYQRLTGVANANPKLIAQQDLDNARAKDSAMESALASAQKRVDENQANVAKMRTLLAYSSIPAPFDGVITRRYADTGALVQAGTASDTQSMPVVDIAEDDVLRLIFPVQESVVPLIRNGLSVEIKVNALNQTFSGTITRYAGKVDVATRTMRTEVDVPNPGGKFIPGMYAEVKLPVEQRKNVVSVPLQALSTGDNPTAMVLNKDCEIEERKVSVGMKTSFKAEILSGLQEGDLVVVGSRTTLRPGQKAVGKLVEISTGE